MKASASIRFSPKDLLRCGQTLRGAFPDHGLLAANAGAGALIEALGWTETPDVPKVALWLDDEELDVGDGRFDFSPEGSLVAIFPGPAGPHREIEAVAALIATGWLPDLGVDLSASPWPAVCLRPAADFDLPDYASKAAAALERLAERNAELETRLTMRLGELEDGQKRLEEWQQRYEIAVERYKETAVKVRANRDKKNYWRERCKRLESSRELRLGRSLLSPLTALRRLAKRGRASLRKRLAPTESPPAYHQWRERTRSAAGAGESLAARLANLARPPKLLLVTILELPAEPELLRRSATSLAAQKYIDWHWIIAATPAAAESTRTTLKKSGLDPARWELLHASLGELYPTLQTTLTASQMDFVALLQPGDEMESHALAEVACLLGEQPERDVIYADEDRVDVRGWLDDPFFKPDWSPDTFLAGNYFGPLAFVRRTLALAVGGLRSGFGPAVGYDLLLRCLETTSRISHLRQPLWHVPQTRPAALEEESHAVEKALARRGLAARAFIAAGAIRVRYEIRDPQKITIIIPTRDRLELLERCLRTIEAQTDYPRYEIVIVDNDSQEDATIAYYRTTPHRVLHYQGVFNFSAMNNYAVAQTDGEWLLLLNNDLEITHADWLSSMAEHIQQPEVGVVGAQLAYPDGTIQHAGVAMGVTGLGGHCFRGFPGDAPGVRGQLQMIRNYSAVTGACLLTRRDVYQQVGGLDERTFPVNFNDIDFCLKVRARGLSVVYTPYARLIHHESASRGRRFENLLSTRAFFAKWADVLADDPFYHPALTRKTEDFAWEENPGEKP